MTYKYTDDDYCDIYENKVCDNCGKCLEMDGIDTKAIKIEDIAKTKEENSILEEEFLNELKSSLDEDMIDEIKDQNLNLKEIYSRFGSFIESDSNQEVNVESSEYEDAFDHIEYIQDLDNMNDADFEEATEEVYPGVRRVRNEFTQK